ncbi:MAG: hypothetical protein A2745_00715 [Candidatus Harrisonbacteria bacterium RIFCSPHIGHO2_01_FULL_44_13]|uniref:Uncharacterized protein n=1 Tax=Candidatus Harrisonbacteria bacterium RIFCSPLOWO2_01_FULL_44_18 TaxID=1798407 RepID=A0A1G1ZMI8_9BACT|nr:MAG: hypothetical protein A2745_00715 [Candidatus Harrisonbacteria bacterium RIFCSPHIGHO2_01_FULL_44_13]OGY65873.1 MAG: hypothetical protein A3A16_02315 [Candidatus Harrisonbacteria bacterium RIFCSPLOWO2_01_FULL_44_18]
MRLYLEDKTKTKNPAALLRQADYHQETDRKTGEVSFVKNIDGRDFPRFHIYAEEKEGGWQINLHLDQKRPSYSGTSAHAGEYDGEVIEKEAGRIKTIIPQLQILNG